MTTSRKCVDISKISIYECLFTLFHKNIFKLFPCCTNDKSIITFDVFYQSNENIDFYYVRISFFSTLIEFIVTKTFLLHNSYFSTLIMFISLLRFCFIVNI